MRTHIKQPNASPDRDRWRSYPVKYLAARSASLSLKICRCPDETSSLFNTGPGRIPGLRHRNGANHVPQHQQFAAISALYLPHTRVLTIPYSVTLVIRPARSIDQHIARRAAWNGTARPQITMQQWRRLLANNSLCCASCAQARCQYLTEVSNQLLKRQSPP